MSQWNFGTGTVIGKRTDVAGAQVAFFGVCQEWSLDIDQKLVPLVGQNKDPVDVAPGERTVTGKIKFARLQASTFGNMLFGVTPTAGAGFTIVGPENHSAIGATTFAVTNGSTFTEDLGLFYHATGVALTPVTSAPSAGQYIPGVAAAGVYTINASDESVSGGIDAFYQQSLTTLFEIDVNTVAMGSGPVLELDITNQYAVLGVNKQLNFQLYAARISKVPFAFKNTAFMIPEMDFTLFLNGSNQLMRWAMSE